MSEWGCVALTASHLFCMLLGAMLALGAVRAGWIYRYHDLDTGKGIKLEDRME